MMPAGDADIMCVVRKKGSGRKFFYVDGTAVVPDGARPKPGVIEMKGKICFVTALIAVLAAGSASFAAEKSRQPMEIEKLLPASGEIRGWMTDGESGLYDSEDLWEYIDGAAEHFLAYGFKKALVQYYTGPGGIELKVEIYEHENSLMAFGIYSQHRSPGAAILDFGNEAFGDDLSLNFWQGDFFVRIYGYEEGGETGKALKEFAAAISGKITDPGAAPLELSLFPEDGMIAHSTTYLTEGVLGTGKLPPAFTARYEQGGGNGRLYIITMETEKEAEGVFDWYAGEIGAVVEKTGSGKGEYTEGTGEAPYRGRVTIFLSGRRIGILTGFEGDGGIERTLASKAVEKFRKIGGGLAR